MANVVKPNSIAVWAQVIGNADAAHRGDAEAAADVILSSLRGYKGGRRALDFDRANLAAALQAYALLLQKAGVVIVETI